MEYAVTATAKATLANIGAGFDCFGLALEAPDDKVCVRTSGQTGVRVAGVEGIGAQDLPHETGLNTAARAAESVWLRRPGLCGRIGLLVTITKGIPAGSGLGSSAASAAAGATAAAAMVAKLGGEPISREELFDAALDGEELASGDRHGDNIAPALFGGFTIVHSVNPLIMARFDPELPLHIAAVLPDVRVSTKQAREMLPREASLIDAKANWASTALLVYALLRGEAGLIRHAMNDRIVEPRRAVLIPGFDAMKEAALRAGAYAFNIGGSGPACFAVCGNAHDADRCGQAIMQALRASSGNGSLWTSHINRQGAEVIR